MFFVLGFLLYELRKLVNVVGNLNHVVPIAANHALAVEVVHKSNKSIPKAFHIIKYHLLGVVANAI